MPQILPALSGLIAGVFGTGALAVGLQSALGWLAIGTGLLTGGGLVGTILNLGPSIGLSFSQPRDDR